MASQSCNFFHDPRSPADTCNHVIESQDKGIIYIAGRDRKMRPSIVFQCGLIDSKTIKVQDFLVALNTVFMIAQQYLFYPGHVENWLILIDTNEIGITSLPTEILK